MVSESEVVRIRNPELAKIGKLLKRVGSDVDASTELLRIAAAYLANRQPIPDALADFLADAFKYAAAAPESANGSPIEQKRIDRLTMRLGLKRINNRPRTIPPAFEVAMIVVNSAEASETKLKKIIADRFGVGESTALTWIKDAKAKVAEARSWLKPPVKAPRQIR